jgi:hypothetical protein
MGAGLIGALAFDARTASRPNHASWLLATIGLPFCASQSSGPQNKTFFRLAMAQTESGSPPAKTDAPAFAAVNQAKAVSEKASAKERAFQKFLTGDSKVGIQALGELPGFGPVRIP